jgi:hypothetical protein
MSGNQILQVGRSGPALTLRSATYCVSNRSDDTSLVGRDTLD